MKIHPPMAQAVVSLLQQIFNEHHYADKAIEKAFKSNRKWGARDRRFIAEMVYDCVRWWRWICFVADVNYEKDNLSDDEVWRVFAAQLLNKKIDLPVWLKIPLSVEQLQKKREQAKGNTAIEQSLPDWIYELGVKHIENWEQKLKALNQQAPIFLRTNQLKLKPESLQQKLQQEEIETEIADPEVGALKLVERKNVFRTEAFKQGFFEVQDIGSQKIAPLLEVAPGQRVIDACAGAGGKSLHLAQLMQNKGRILALDIHQWKLDELKKRAKRNAVGIIETRVIDNNKVIKRQRHKADRLLLDVPCTGLGVLRRNPDTKWKLNKERLQDLLNLQKEILQNYSSMVKPGGKMVYATCSVLPMENEDQVKHFLSHNETWSLEQEIFISPGDNDGDGFYAARLKHQ